MKNVILAEFPMIDYTLIARVTDNAKVYEFVCAWHYDENSKSWGSRSLLQNFSHCLLFYTGKTQTARR